MMKVTSYLDTLIRLYITQYVLLAALSISLMRCRSRKINDHERMNHEAEDDEKNNNVVKKRETAHDNSICNVFREVWEKLMKAQEFCLYTKKVGDWELELSAGLLASLSIPHDVPWSGTLSWMAKLWFQSLHRHETFMRRLEPVMSRLTYDLQAHILCFLHPKDIVTFGCCNSECQKIVSSEDHPTFKLLWKKLWDRDFAWLVESWDIGIEARKRSVCKSRDPDKQLYFEFGQTYVNFLIAGHNNVNDCLLGLHGNIYDVSSFLDQHPGMAETILVNSGQDATRAYEDIGHSTAARNQSIEYCLVVDLSLHDRDGFGTRSGSEVSKPLRMLPSGKYRRKAPTLYAIRKRLQTEERKAKTVYLRLVPYTIMAEVTVYYDAFDRKWKAWCIDESLENIFLS
jgi:Cytochrome b5-like Heme/Steroid binding domain